MMFMMVVVSYMGYMVKLSFSRCLHLLCTYTLCVGIVERVVIWLHSFKYTSVHTNVSVYVCFEMYMASSNIYVYRYVS